MYDSHKRELLCLYSKGGLGLASRFLTSTLDKQTYASYELQLYQAR